MSPCTKSRPIYFVLLFLLLFPVACSTTIVPASHQLKELIRRELSKKRRELRETANSTDSAAPSDETKKSEAKSTTNNKGDDTSQESKERCTVLGECELCPHGGRKSNDEEGCEETGRRQRFNCVVTEGDSGKPIKSRKEYRSCRRTRADEQFLMVRMQAICALLGTLSLISVRRQKLRSASLFDQRRPPRGRRGSNAGGTETGKRGMYTAIPQSSGTANEKSSGGDGEGSCNMEDRPAPSGVSAVEMV